MNFGAQENNLFIILKYFISIFKISLFIFKIFIFLSSKITADGDYNHATTSHFCARVQCLSPSHSHTDTDTCQNATCAQQAANTLMKCHHTVIFVFVTEHTKPTLSN